MITGISTNIASPNIETLSVSGRLTPESNYIQILVVKSDLSEDQQAIYTNGVNLVSGKFITKIINTTAELNIDRMTSVVIEEGINDIDFQALTTTKKNKLNALFSLFSELSNL